MCCIFCELHYLLQGNHRASLFFMQVLEEPNAMAVASCSPEGQPSLRYVLLKGYDERGFVFYTNYNSRKGQELASGGRTALAFWWEALQRQVGPIYIGLVLGIICCSGGFDKNAQSMCLFWMVCDTGLR